jgi:hypothetical protein
MRKMLRQWLYRYIIVPAVLLSILVGWALTRSVELALRLRISERWKPSTNITSEGWWFIDVADGLPLTL